jgi:hypothetical protein
VRPPVNPTPTQAASCDWRRLRRSGDKDKRDQRDDRGQAWHPADHANTVAFARQAGQACLVQARTTSSSTELVRFVLAAAALLTGTAAGATPPSAATPTATLVVEPINEAAPD